MKKAYIYLFIGIILLTLISPALFTQLNWLIAFDAESGSIGDTIGGITSPFINVLGSILIFISFQEQVKANTMQMENQNIDRFSKDFDEVKKEFYQVEFNYKEIHPSINNKVFESSLDMYSQDLEIRREGNISFEFRFKYILYLIQYFIEEIEISNLTVSNKRLLFKKMYQFYYSNIQFHIENSIDLADEFDYNVPFIVLAKNNSQLIEDKRIYYNIKKTL